MGFSQRSTCGELFWISTPVACLVLAQFHVLHGVDTPTDLYYRGPLDCLQHPTAVGSPMLSLHTPCTSVTPAGCSFAFY